MSANLTLFYFFLSFLVSFLLFSMTSQTAGNDPLGVSKTSEMEMEINKRREKFLISVTKLVESKSYNSKVFYEEKYLETIKSKRLRRRSHHMIIAM